MVSAAGRAARSKGSKAWHASHDCSSAHGSSSRASQAAKAWHASHDCYEVHVRAANQVTKDLHDSHDCHRDHGLWRGDAVGYNGAHTRVTSAKGSASDHLCVDCGDRAQDWSYDHRDPGGKQGTNKGSSMWFSADPDHYEPRCKPCHRRFDGQQKAQNGQYSARREHDPVHR